MRFKKSPSFRHGVHAVTSLKRTSCTFSSNFSPVLGELIWVSGKQNQKQNEIARRNSEVFTISSIDVKVGCCIILLVNTLQASTKNKSKIVPSNYPVISSPSIAEKVVENAQEVRFSDVAAWMPCRNDSDFSKRAGIKNLSGRLSFAYFSLATQRKVRPAAGKTSYL